MFPLLLLFVTALWGIALFVTALVGHLAIWVALFNQIHATAMPRKYKKLSQMVVILSVLFLGVFLAAGFFIDGDDELRQASSKGISSTLTQFSTPWHFYTLICWLATTAVTVRWGVFHIIDARPKEFVSDEKRTVHMKELLREDPCGDSTTRFLASLPFNQILQLDVHEKCFHLEDLPDELDGFSIAHFSDLHMTGKLSQEFFEIVIEQTNRLQADMIAVTGDIIDKEDCFHWLQPLFSKLSAPYGVFYVLGNHDHRIKDTSRLRGTLNDAGMIELNGVWHEMEYNGFPLHLTGNELPWFTGAESLDHEDVSHIEESFRILLSHSPDQFSWAQRHQFDLMLAGHTHGGQIRPPIIGPIVSPSRQGCRYASGVFQRNGTLMHVSRGVSGVDPIRINCAPEITKLIFKKAVKESRRVKE